MKVCIVTLGCKTNQYESNAIAQSFLKKGYKVVNADEDADIYIVNTCTVTSISDKKSRQFLRRAKEKNKNAIVVACGCYVQVAKEDIEKMEEVDIILGNNEKKNAVDYVEKFLENHNEKKKEKVQEIAEQKKYLEMGSTTYTKKARAVIKIQDRV